MAKVFGKDRTVKQELHSSAAVFALLVWTLGGVMTADAAISGTPPANVTDLIAKANQALKAGQPDVAIIYLKNAETEAPDSAEVHMQLGSALLSSGNASEAEREFGTAQKRGEPNEIIQPLIYQAMLAQREAELLLNRYPAPGATDHALLAAETLRARALAQLQLGKPQDAAASLDNALSIARNAQNLIARAQLAFDTGDDNLAEKLTDEALSKDPVNSGALIMKISILQRAKKTDDALGFANKFVKANNSSPLSLLTRAGVFLQLNQYDKASADLDAITKVAPNVAQVIFFKALIQARQKDAHGAWALAQTLPRNFPTSRPEVGIAVGQMAIDAGQHDSGVDILHSTMEAFPQNPDVRVHLAEAYLNLHEIPEVLDTLSPLQNSADPRVQVILARAYADQKNFGQSLQSLSKANANGFGGDILKLRLANADIQEGKLNEARTALEDLNSKQPGKPEIAGPLVTVLLRMGQTNEALQIANSLEKLSSASPYGPLYVGTTLTQTGDFDGAILAFSEAIKREPKFIPAIFDRATAFSSKGDYQAAQTDLQTVLSLSPQSTGASVKLAQIFEQTGQDDKALLVLQKAATANPRDFSVTSALTQFYVIRNRTADALKALAAFQRSSPNNPDAITMQGDLEVAAGHADEAINTYRALQGKYPKSWQLSLRLAAAYSQKNDLANAVSVLRKAIAVSPGVGELRAALVGYGLLAKNQSAAYADAQQFVAQIPGALADRALASVLIAMNKKPDAESLLSKSLANNPDRQTALELNQLLRVEGKNQQADAIMAGWIAHHPDDFDMRLSYALPKMIADKRVADDQFQTILRRDPYNVTALNDEAWLWGDSNPDRGLALAIRAQKVAPNMPQVRDTLGWIKWRMGQRDDAVALLSQAHKQLPKDPEIGYHLAVVLRGTGRAADAKQLLSSLLSDQTTFTDRQNAQVLYEKIK